MAIFPCSNLLSDGKIQDLGYLYLKWTSWSSLLQQQQWGLGLFSTHSQALGTAARYQRLRHHCAVHIHSCCAYWLCCSEISDSMHERVVVSVRIYLVLAYICLICYLDYYHRMAKVARTPAGDQLQPPAQAHAGCPGCPHSFWNVCKGGISTASQHPAPALSPWTRKCLPAYINAWGCCSSGAGPCTSWGFPRPISPAILYCYIWSKSLQNHLFALDSAD